MDGELFHSITAATVVTSVDSNTLDPIYFSSGMFIRCSCVPVSRDGRHGHKRISDTVRLGDESRCSGDTAQGNVEVKLSSYDTFGAKNEVQNANLICV